MGRHAIAMAAVRALHPVAWRSRGGADDDLGDRTMVKTSDDVARFYAWYCGRFYGVCEMLRQPSIYTDHNKIIEQLLMVADDYQQEREREGLAS